MFDFLERVLLPGDFAVGNVLFKNLHFSPIYYTNLNLSVTKIFSLAKGNLFYKICYVTKEIVPFQPWDRKGCAVAEVPAGDKQG